jgi:hypothetical protein
MAANCETMNGGRTDTLPKKNPGTEKIRSKEDYMHFAPAQRQL